ncbi:MAG TPA: hypothetical protein VLJ17_00245 [Xanthobacteraceae bacterium]|nr:hypothetical protein [Xanthobacteraceae bacterium]
MAEVQVFPLSGASQLQPVAIASDHRMWSSGGKMVNYKKLIDPTGRKALVIDAGWTAIDGPPTGLTQVG